MREIIKGHASVDPHAPLSVCYTLRYGSCHVRDISLRAAHRSFQLKRWKYYLSSWDYKKAILVSGLPI